MLQVSDYLTAEQDNLPILNHDVALDTEAPALAAILIAGILEEVRPLRKLHSV